MFKTKYNGKINWVQTTWETKFDDLAALVMSNDSPDFIGADDMDVFPKGAIKSMIELSTIISIFQSLFGQT